MADAGYLTIGKVVKRLQPQYPDLSVSKVRYLEDEGLLTPSRTPGGYRLYSARDIQRLETILYLQKSRFLPLSVIKEELDGRSVPAEPDPYASGSKATSATANRATLPTDDVDVPLAAGAGHGLHPIERMPEVAGVSISFVRRLSECGIVALIHSPHGRDLVDGRDLSLICACEELRRFGIEPKNLRQYVAASNRESIMFEQALVSLPRHQGESEQDRHLRMGQAFDRVLSLTNVVRGSLIRRSLKGTVDKEQH